MARGKFDRNKVRDGGIYELTADQSCIVEEKIAQAEAELLEARVNFRWGKKQIQLVKMAADLVGVPYQTYIKQVVYRQCLKDISEHNAMSKIIAE